MLTIFVIALASLTIALMIRVNQLDKQMKSIGKIAASMLHKKPNG